MPTRAPPRPGPLALGRPPAATEGRGRHDADDHVRAVDEGDQGGPDGYAAYVVLGAVDRVEDPAATGVGGALGQSLVSPKLLADDPVVGSGRPEVRAQQLLGRTVGIADRGEVRLGLDDEVERLEPVEGQQVSGVGHGKPESQVVGVRRHNEEVSRAMSGDI